MSFIFGHVSVSCLPGMFLCHAYLGKFRVMFICACFYVMFIWYFSVSCLSATVSASCLSAHVFVSC